MRFACSARVVAGFLFAFAACSQVDAAQPSFGDLQPHGVQRGTEAVIRLTGERLEDAEELMLYDRGMEVIGFAHPADPNQVGREITVKLRIAADCPVGPQRLRIRTRTGLSNIQNLYVGALPVVFEVENNGDFAAPQAISQNVTVHGRVDNEDVDYFVVEAKAGQRLSAEVYGMRLGYSSGGNFFDPYVAILNAERFELSASDDTPLVWNDAVASITVPEDGKYIVQIRDAAYQGDGRAYYLLSIGSFPRPQAVIPSGGKPGETLTVTYLGDPLGPITREVTLPESVPDVRQFGLEVQDEYGVAASRQPFRISPLDNTLEVEPNNELSTATPAPAVGAFNGVISEPGDVDCFRFPGQQGVTYEVQVYARRIRSPLDSVVAVYRADNGGGIGSNDDAVGPDARMEFQAPENTDFVVMVYDHLRKGGENFAYRVEVTPVAPSIDAQPIEIARYVQPNIEVPQGSGSGIVVNVSRNRFGGPVMFRCDNLPPGVRIECPEDWRDEGQASLVLYADENAPVCGRYCDIVTYLADPNQPNTAVEGRLSQEMLMILGQNQQRVWYESITRVPVIVTNKLPCRVWAEVPQIPIVRGGQMNLVVRCEKYDGWDEDIAVRLLQNPSGINASGSVTIPKGQTEALLPMNASGDAAVQTASICLRCTARVGSGNVDFCTPFIPLRVEEQYVTFEFAQGAVNQGQETGYLVTVKKRKDFEGEAQVTLLGLPANATVEPLKMTKDTAELIFTIKAPDTTPVGMNKNLFCQVLVPEVGQMIVHNLGNGVLRVDPPPPMPVVASSEPMPMPMPEAVVEAAPPPRPLSRLEQLRLQQAEREKAAAGGE